MLDIFVLFWSPYKYWCSSFYIPPSGYYLDAKQKETDHNMLQVSVSPEGGYI